MSHRPGYIKVYKGDDTLHNYPLKIGKKYIVGRSPSCDIRFEEYKLISRVHGVIDVRSEGVFYTDKSSTNGSEIEGAKLLKENPVKLREGQAVRLGKSPVSIIISGKYWHSSTKKLRIKEVRERRR